MTDYTAQFIGETDVGASFAHTANAPPVSTGANVLMIDRNAGLFTLAWNGSTIVAENVNSASPFPISITGGEIFAPTREGLGAIYAAGTGGANQTLKTYSRSGYALTEQTSTPLGYHLRQWPFVPSADGSVFAAYTDNNTLSDPRFRIFEGSISTGFSVALDVAGKTGVFTKSFSSFVVDGPVCSADGTMIITAHSVAPAQGEIVFYEKIAGAWTQTTVLNAAFFGESVIGEISIRIATDNSVVVIKFLTEFAVSRIAILKYINAAWVIDHMVLSGYWSEFKNAIAISADNTYMIGGDAEYQDFFQSGDPWGQMYVLDLATYEYTRITPGGLFTGGGGMGSRIGGPIAVSAGVEVWYAYDFDLGPLLYPIKVTAAPGVQSVSGAQMLQISYSLAGADFDPAALVYRLVMRSGSAPDLVIPMQALTVRKAGRRQTELSIFARVSADMLDAISERIEDTILVERGLGNIWGTLFSGLITNLSPQDDRMTISAAGSRPGAGGIVRQVGRVSFLSGGSGALRFHAELDGYMEPGDIAESDVGVIKVASVTLYFAPESRFMAIAEDG